MEKDDKLIIKSKKYGNSDTTIVSARIPVDLVSKIDDIAKKTNHSRNEMLQILLSFAVDRAEIGSGEEEA